MKYAWILAVLSVWTVGLNGQVNQQIEELEAKRSALAKQDEALRDSLQGLKLANIQQKLAQMGWPSADNPVISHPGFALRSAEAHEQARWVAHIVLTDIQEGNEGRTNKFMEDPKVATGSAQEVDYFLKTPKPSGGYTYDGYGFDRGHLAPSADFKWSAEALAASYFYSNMSPQRPGFNRGRWARLEGFVREECVPIPNRFVCSFTACIV
jgi:DNA/RNA endonuclease G, NUC1